jgi:ribosomal protein S18 acetylase RimI-like enzyme
VDALMAEWIRVSVEGTFADAVLISDTQPPHAFVTLRLQKTNWKTLGIAAADISLIAVDPRYPGWFPRLASEALLFGRSRGAEAITVTTQAGNKGVIRTLEGLEFHRVQSEEVFRKIL